LTLVPGWKNFDSEHVRALAAGTPFRQEPGERICPACGVRDVRSYLYRSDGDGRPTLIGSSWPANCHRYDGSTGPYPTGMAFDDPMDELAAEDRRKLRGDLDRPTVTWTNCGTPAGSLSRSPSEESE
jgi:hypothetical protein